MICCSSVSVECFGIPAVGDHVVDVAAARSDRESIDAVVGLRPPAIENAAVQSAVEDDLLTAGTAGLQAGVADCSTTHRPLGSGGGKR